MKGSAEFLIMVCLFYPSVFRVVSSQNSSTASLLIDFVEFQVKEIVAKALTNYENACELAATCQARNCSRQECHPYASSIDDYMCAQVSNISYCQNSSGPIWTSIQANFGRSYIRTPPINIAVGGSIKDAIGETICSQRELDPVFQDVHMNISASSLSFFFNLYFGSIDGTFRYYPGREVSQGCGLYDHRVRPWFTGATSVLKDVVILFDTGQVMVNDFGFLTEHSPLDIAKNLTSKVLQTLVVGDRYTLVPFNEAGVVPANEPIQDIIPRDPSTAMYQQSLEALLNNPAFDAGNYSGPAVPSNFTAGFMEAFKVFNDSSHPRALKIVFLFTDLQGNSPTSDAVATVLALAREGAKLFIYDLGSNHQRNNSDWVSLGGQAGGYYEQLVRTKVVTNPLLSLNAYFSYLSRSRMLANGNKAVPFWQAPYEDATGLGKVITVSFPAMSQQEELVGVAAIDVQVAGLGDLSDDIENMLNTAKSSSKSSSLSISIFPKGADLTNYNGTEGYNIGTKPPCPIPTNYEPLCQAPQANERALIEAVCYGVCRPGSKSKLGAGELTGITIGAVLGLSLLGLLVIFFVIRRVKRRRPIRSLSGFLTDSIVKYTYHDLLKATNYFDEKREIGRGRYGTVYRAILHEASTNEESVAVKRLKQTAEFARDLQREQQIMYRVGLHIKHENIVELKGICLDIPDECFLVYELVELGDMYHWLWPAEDLAIEKRHILTWEERIKIAAGVANGLKYLHSGMPSVQVYHLDIKPQNILLEADFNPKIADFGISRFHEPGQTVNVTTVNAGTFGYIAPEVFDGATTPNQKLDSFSYGVILLHLFSGRKIDDTDGKPSLRSWALRHETENAYAYMDRVVDPKLVESMEDDCAEVLRENCVIMIELALLCLQEDARQRPDMDTVLEVIQHLPQLGSLESSTSVDDEGNLLLHSINSSKEVSHASYFTAQIRDHSGLLSCQDHSGLLYGGE